MTPDWMLFVPFLAVIMDVIHVFSMFHKEIAMKENNAWRDQGPVLCNKLTAALLFFVNVVALLSHAQQLLGSAVNVFTLCSYSFQMATLSVAELIKRLEALEAAHKKTAILALATDRTFNVKNVAMS